MILRWRRPAAPVASSDVLFLICVFLFLDVVSIQSGKRIPLLYQQCLFVVLDSYRSGLAQAAIFSLQSFSLWMGGSFISQFFGRGSSSDGPNLSILPIMGTMMTFFTPDPPAESTLGVAKEFSWLALHFDTWLVNLGQ